MSSKKVDFYTNDKGLAKKVQQELSVGYEVDTTDKPDQYIIDNLEWDNLKPLLKQVSCEYIVLEHGKNNIVQVLKKQHPRKNN
jgi:hypothetical protein